MSQRSQTGKVGEPSGVTDGPSVAAAASTTDSTASLLVHTERAAAADLCSFILDFLRRNNCDRMNLVESKFGRVLILMNQHHQ